MLDARPELAEAVGLDSSPPMLELARQRFHGDDARVVIDEHDLERPLPGLGAVRRGRLGLRDPPPGARAQAPLFGEIAAILRPGGVFANLEVVQCATPELHEEFNRRIERPGGDPEDVLAEVEPQLGWMRAAGLVQVDCNWRWRGFALLVGQAPSAG